MGLRPRSFVELLLCRRVVLLQGPMGPFFKRLSEFLTNQGAAVRRVVFNGGDWLFHSGPGTERYSGSEADWPDWLAERLRDHRADAVVLFGQSRPMHRLAMAVASRLGIAVYVFEEGYVRPDFVTLECGGVNGRSSLPRDPRHYDGTPNWTPHPLPTKPSFARMALYAISYAVAMAVCRPLFPQAAHHRPLKPIAEAGCWLRGGWRKLVHRIAQRHVLAELASPAVSQQWFLLVLQVHNDAQIRDHSPFADMGEVIGQVMESFAAMAPADRQLVIKHHPMDRPYRDYGRFIARQAERFGLVGRVRYVHDLHLPSLLRHAAGVVTVNSTVGLQAMFHGRPVCTLGDAVYGLPGLVHQGGLASFWHAPTPVDGALFGRFRSTVIQQTQLNLSFYGRMPALMQPQPVPRAVRPALENVERLAELHG